MTVVYVFKTEKEESILNGDITDSHKTPSNEREVFQKMANVLKKLVPAIGVAAGGTWAGLTTFNDE